MMNKIIVIDEGVFSSKAILSWGAQKLRILNKQMPENAFLPPVSYIWFMMAISALKRIGVNKNDLILIARDKTNSWRKIFYKPYKAQRWEQREEKSHIDWMYHYGIIDNFLDQLAESTNWHVLWYPRMWQGVDLMFSKEGEQFLNENEIDNDTLNKYFSVEADDWIACASKYYSDREVIFVSIDADLDQLCTRENTKFFTLTQKHKGGTGVYKLVENGYQVLAKKIEKGDKGDNILPSVTDDNSEKAQNLRKLIIDLLNLPSWVEEECFKVFDNLPEKEIDYSKLPFQNSLAKKFPQIYEKDKIITYEDSVKHFTNKKKKVAKKAKEARERKKKEKEQLTMIGE